MSCHVFDTPQIFLVHECCGVVRLAGGVVPSAQIPLGCPHQPRKKKPIYCNFLLQDTENCKFFLGNSKQSCTCLPDLISCRLLVEKLMLSLVDWFWQYFQEDSYLYLHSWTPWRGARWPFPIKFVICFGWSKDFLFWCKITWDCFGYCKGGNLILLLFPFCLLWCLVFCCYEYFFLLIELCFAIKN